MFFSCLLPIKNSLNINEVVSNKGHAIPPYLLVNHPELSVAFCIWVLETVIKTWSGGFPTPPL